MSPTKKSLRDFYEEEAKRFNHQELMYARGNKHEVWWHRKRLHYIFCFLAEMLRNPKVVTFADIGCAEGCYVNCVAFLRNDTFCIGADVAKTYIKRPKERPMSENLTLTSFYATLKTYHSENTVLI